jgi:hypothetical protein
MRYSLEDLKKVKLEAGMYIQARQEKMSFTQWIEKYLAVDKQIVGSPYVNESGIAKSLYEIVQEKRRMKAMNLPMAPTAFELLLEAKGISAYGRSTSKVNKFFSSSDPMNRVLFPEWISTVVYYDHLDMSVLENLISNIIIIDGHTFTKRKIDDVSTTGAFELGETVQGTSFPRIDVQLSETSNELRKYGAWLRYTYESIENMTLNQFRTEVLSIIARKIALSKSARVIYVLINGDGTSSGLPAGNIETSNNTGVIDRYDIMNFITSTSQGYQINAAVTPITYWRLYHATMSEMTNPQAQKAEMNIPFPMVYRWDGSYLTADYVLGVDNRYAAAWFTNDNMTLEESEKVITDQTVNQVISIRGEAVILDANAIGALNVVH